MSSSLKQMNIGKWDYCHVVWHVVFPFNFSLMWGFIDNSCISVVRSKFRRTKRDQRSEREHVSRNWLGLCDFFVTKFREFVTSLSRKMGTRDFYVTKNWNFVTYLSRKIRISWLICHETKLFKSRNSTFSWHTSHEMGYFDGI